MTATTGTPAFVGRAAEIEVLGTLVAGRGAQRVALVRGEPGIGKTELLARIDTPGRTVRVGGSESEAHLPFAVLADLVLPLRDALAALPDVQREALEVSVALRAGRAGAAFLLESVEGGAVRGRYSISGLEPDGVGRCSPGVPALPFTHSGSGPSSGRPVKNFAAMHPPRQLS